MTRRFLAGSLHIGWILLCASGVVQAAESDDQAHRMNILLISLDTVRPDHLSCYGYDRETTPHIDRIAQDGVRFTSAFVQAPNTFPSHLAIFTSRYPTYQWISWKEGDAGSSESLTEILKAHGYQTAGFTHFTSSALQPLLQTRPFQAFDHLVAGSRLKLLPDGLFEWLEAHRDEPFFLFLHELDAHEPHVVPVEYDAKRFNPAYQGRVPGTWTELDSWFASEMPQGGDRTIPRRTAELDVKEHERYVAQFADDTPPEDLQHLLALYDAQLHYLDQGLGQVFQALENLDLMDRTIIVILSDHGQTFGEHGTYVRHAEVYDEIIRMVLLVRDPRMERRGKLVRQMVQGIDVMPTILELLDLAVPEGAVGKSLVPLLRNERDTAWEEVAVAVGPGMRAIRTPQWKLITRGGHPAELYQLGTDPLEQQNVIGRHPDITGQLQSRLDAVVMAEVAGPAVDPNQWIREHGYW